MFSPNRRSRNGGKLKSLAVHCSETSMVAKLKTITLHELRRRNTDSNCCIMFNILCMDDVVVMPDFACIV